MQSNTGELHIDKIHRNDSGYYTCARTKRNQLNHHAEVLNNIKLDVICKLICCFRYLQTKFRHRLNKNEKKKLWSKQTEREWKNKIRFVFTCNSSNESIHFFFCYLTFVLLLKRSNFRRSKYDWVRASMSCRRVPLLRELFWRRDYPKITYSCLNFSIRSEIFYPRNSFPFIEEPWNWFPTANGLISWQDEQFKPSVSQI